MTQRAIYEPCSPKQAMMLKAALEAQVVIIGGAAGCLDAKAQFLTKEGWVNFDSYKEGMEVAQYSPEVDTLSFTDNVSYVKLKEKNLTRLRGKGLEMTLSDEHKVLYWNDKLENHRTLSFSEVKERHTASKTKGWTGRVKTTFKVAGTEGINLTEGELRLQVAVMADGRVVKEGKDNYTQMRFSKKRKYDRILNLCKTYGLRYDDRGSKDHDKYLSGKAYEIIVWPKLKDKRFDSKYWNCTQSQLDIIADEVTHWDGSFSPTGSKSYCSRHEADVDFIQYVFASQGMNTSKLADSRKDNTYWTVNGNNSGKGFRSFANKDKKIPLETVPTTDGYKYCFTTETGFLLVRENGKVYLTGNSGKSYILQLIPLFLVNDGRTTCRMFRRTTPQIKGQGGIWDTGSDIYLSLPTEQRPRKREQKMEFIWPNGARVDYSHMERVSDKLNIQGLQFTFIGVDKLVANVHKAV